MHTKFRVNTTFVRSSDKNTVLCGLITSGTVKKGMKVKVEVSPKLYFTADILSVEAICDTTGKSNVGLVLDTADDDMRNLWRELPAPAEEIAIE